MSESLNLFLTHLSGITEKGEAPFKEGGMEKAEFVYLDKNLKYHVLCNKCENDLKVYARSTEKNDQSLTGEIGCSCGNRMILLDGKIMKQ